MLIVDNFYFVYLKMLKQIFFSLWSHHEGTREVNLSASLDAVDLDTLLRAARSRFSIAVAPFSTGFHSYLLIQVRRVPRRQSVCLTFTVSRLLCCVPQGSVRFVVHPADFSSLSAVNESYTSSLITSRRSTAACRLIRQAS